MSHQVGRRFQPLSFYHSFAEYLGSEASRGLPGCLIRWEVCRSRSLPSLVSGRSPTPGSSVTSGPRPSRAARTTTRPRTPRATNRHGSPLPLAPGDPSHAAPSGSPALLPAPLGPLGHASHLASAPQLDCLRRRSSPRLATITCPPTSRRPPLPQPALTPHPSAP
jgi:hypothetical protein